MEDFENAKKNGDFHALTCKKTETLPEVKETENKETVVPYTAMQSTVASSTPF